MLKAFRKIRETRGLTLVETLMSIGIAVIIIVSVAMAATYSLQFNSYEKSRTLAQDVARNIMNQHVRNAKFADIKSWADSAAANNNNFIMYDFTNPNVDEARDANDKLSDTIKNDLNKLKSSKALLSFKALNTDQTQYDVQVRVLWQLQENGAEYSGTRKVELPTIVSQYDQGQGKTSIAIAATATPPPPDTCDVETGKPISCPCVTGSECASGDCTENLCSDPCSAEANRPLNCNCTTASQCASGKCSNGNPGVCEVNPCSVTINKPLNCACAASNTLGDMQCESGFCNTSLVCASRSCGPNNKDRGCPTTDASKCRSNNAVSGICT